MHIKVMTWLSISVLLAAMLFWSTAPDFQPQLNAILCITAVVVVFRAYQAKKLSARPLLSMPSITDRNPDSRSL